MKRSMVEGLVRIRGGSTTLCTLQGVVVVVVVVVRRWDFLLGGVICKVGAADKVFDKAIRKPFCTVFRLSSFVFCLRSPLFPNRYQVFFRGYIEKKK